MYKQRDWEAPASSAGHCKRSSPRATSAYKRFCPGATATDFWDLAGTSLDQVPGELVMKVDDMVDAALAGFDQGELITIPSLPDVADWETYEAARQNLIPKLSRRSPAARSGVMSLNPNGAGAPK